MGHFAGDDSGFGKVSGRFHLASLLSSCSRLLAFKMELQKGGGEKLGMFGGVFEGNSTYFIASEPMNLQQAQHSQQLYERFERNSFGNHHLTLGRHVNVWRRRIYAQGGLIEAVPKVRATTSPSAFRDSMIVAVPSPISSFLRSFTIVCRNEFCRTLNSMFCRI